MHACTPIYVYRDIHTFMHTCMNSIIHKSKPPSPLSHRPQTKGKMIFIHSFNLDISIVHYYSEALPTTVIDNVGVYTTKRYRQPYTVYTAYNIYYIHSFINFEHFYSAPSRRLLRSAPDSSTAKKESF